MYRVSYISLTENRQSTHTVDELSGSLFENTKSEIDSVELIATKKIIFDAANMERDVIDAACVRSRTT